MTFKKKKGPGHGRGVRVQGRGVRGKCARATGGVGQCKGQGNGDGEGNGDGVSPIPRNIPFVLRATASPPAYPGRVRAFANVSLVLMTTMPSQGCECHGLITILTGLFCFLYEVMSGVNGCESPLPKNPFFRLSIVESHRYITIND